MKKFTDLNKEAQQYIDERFSHYKISGEDAFNSDVFPDELKELNSDQIVEFLKNKDISHVLPQSTHPEFSHNLNNIILENPDINRSRGAEIMTEEEISDAKFDNISEIQEFEESVAFMDTLPDVLLGSTAIGLGLSTIKAYQNLKSGDIELNDTPRFIIVDSGGKIVRCAIIGACATSGTPILVAAGFGYIVYKFRKLLKLTWNVINHKKTIKKVKATFKASASVIGGLTSGLYSLSKVLLEK